MASDPEAAHQAFIAHEAVKKKAAKLLRDGAIFAFGLAGGLDDRLALAQHALHNPVARHLGR